MNIKLTKNEKTDILKVSIDGKKFGSIDSIDDNYRFFPANTHRMTGNHFIEIGKKLNELNDNPCNLCTHNGGQSVLGSGCTGCSVIREFGNFDPV